MRVRQRCAGAPQVGAVAAGALAVDACRLGHGVSRKRTGRNTEPILSFRPFPYAVSQHGAAVDGKWFYVRFTNGGKNYGALFAPSLRRLCAVFVPLARLRLRRGTDFSAWLLRWPFPMRCRLRARGMTSCSYQGILRQRIPAPGRQGEDGDCLRQQIPTTNPASHRLHFSACRRGDGVQRGARSSA